MAIFPQKKKSENYTNVIISSIFSGGLKKMGIRIRRIVFHNLVSKKIRKSQGPRLVIFFNTKLIFHLLLTTRKN